MAPVILVVDDDPDISLMLTDRLTFLNFQVVTATHGEEGLSTLKNMAINGVLLDIQMPVMDGITMLRHIREQNIRVPVIVMSAQINTKMLIEAIEKGASDYLLKPIDVDLLTKKCSAVFSSSEGITPPHTINDM